MYCVIVYILYDNKYKSSQELQLYTVWTEQSFKYTGGIMVGYFEIICGVVALLLVFYYYSVSAFGFWRSRGVPGPKPTFFFGNTTEHMLARIPMAQYQKKLYEDYKNEPMVGLYIWRSPVLFLKDPELIKDVMIKDFPIFSDRGLTVHERVRHVAFLCCK